MSRTKLALLFAALLLVPATVHAEGPLVDQSLCMVEWDEPVTNADGTPLDDLAKYRVYFGATPEALATATPSGEVLATSPSPAPGSRVSVSCAGLPLGQWYAQVTAVDAAGNESARSLSAAVEIVAAGTPIPTDSAPSSPGAPVFSNR